MRIFDQEGYLAALHRSRQEWHSKYYAFYSSLLDGVTLDPVYMQVPIDDHLVHRGDGVFDTFKCVNRAAYNLHAHLRRLERSCQAIGLNWPGGTEEIRQLTLATLAAANRNACTGRVMVARGPGSFGVNPYDSPTPALYIMVYATDAPFMERHPQGARVRRSRVPAKPAHYATVKHCNYLPNVMMKRESIDWNVDFVVGFDDRGIMTEGATENFGIVTRERDLLFPRMGAVLPGTTMLRVMELADQLVAAGELSRVGFRDIMEPQLREADELLAVGTTINVVSAREYEGRPVGCGAPGPIARRLDALLQEDVLRNSELRTTYG